MDRFSVLVKDDFDDLVHRRLASHPDARGYLRIHKRMQQGNWLSNIIYPDISLATTLDAADSDHAFVTVPAQLYSPQTLEYVGYSASRAAALWHFWTHGPSHETDPEGCGLDMEFGNFICDHLARDDPADASEAESEDDSAWYAFLERCGIGRELQDAIMEPEFRDLRLSNSCTYWVQDTIQERYAGLVMIRKESQKRAEEMQRRREAQPSK